MARKAIVPSQCVYVAQAAPNKNYYEKTAVFTGRFKRSNDIYRFFLKYELDSIVENIKSNLNIKSAFLNLQLIRNEIPADPGATNIYIYRLLNSFNEKEITWNTQPEPALDADSVTQIQAFRKGEIKVDVTDLLKGWVDGSIINNGILIKGEELINSLIGFSGINQAQERLMPTLTVNYDYEINEKDYKSTSFNVLYTSKSEHFASYLDLKISDDTRKLALKLKDKKYKGIVAYPSLIKWKSNIRPHLILKDLASNGYLCIFCNPPSDKFNVSEVNENLFVINNEDYLIPYLKNKFIIVLCNSPIQLAWAKYIQNKIIWYDIIEKLNIYDQDFINIHDELIENADIVSYSAKQFKEYTSNRENAILMTNKFTKNFELNLLKLKNGLMPFANIDNRGMAAVMTSTFLGVDGKNFYTGGAERYLCDLHKVFDKMGKRMLVYQHGDRPWVRRYNDIDVISLSDGSANKTFNNNFYELTELTTLINIYSAFFEGYPRTSSNSIGISHGVAWDSPSYVFYSGEQFWNRNKRFIDSARLFDILVSVDTNTASWFQSIDFNVGRNMKYIPNYVDISEFNPRQQNENLRDKTIILFPRRLYAARGYYMLLEIVDDILEKYKNVEFHFVGRGIEKDTIEVEKKQKKWGERVKWYNLNLSEMPNVYKNADITTIPSLNSEGTSLSCLEAMASGNAVISTRVGGLSDLIINGYNGVLIDPAAQELKNAIEDLLDNPSKLNILKKNAVEVSKAFSKSIWESKWRDIIKSMIDVSIEEKTKAWKLVEIYLKNIDTFAKPSVLKYIAELLCDDCLVYIKVEALNKSPFESYGRLQFLDWNEEVLAKSDYIVADENSAGIINKNIDLILTKEWIENLN